MMYQAQNNGFAYSGTATYGEKIPVVSSSVVYDGSIAVKEDIYTYYNAVLHRQGLGFCGFEKIVTKDINGLFSTQIYDPFRRGILLTEYAPTYKKDYTYELKTNADKTLSARLLKLSEEDLLKGISAETSYEYDEFDYPIKESKNYSTGVSVMTQRTYSHDSEVEYGYNLGYVVNETEVTTTPTGSVSKATAVMSHENRQPLDVVEYIDGNQTKETLCEYDSYGNILSRKEFLYESDTPLTETYEYDLYKRPCKHVDKKGEATQYLYTPYSYFLYQKITKYGREIYNYDALGRLISVTSPDGTERTLSYEWALKAGNWVCEPENGLYAVIDSCPGKPTKLKVYDRFNRLVREGETLFDGKVKKVDRIYDINGNLISLSEPFTSFKASSWTSYEYDNYNRKVSMNAPSGKQTLYSYNGLGVSTTENGLTTTKVYDVFDNLISVSSPNGTVTYEYAADGQQISITSNSVKTTFEYDQYRRQTSINDPSLGTTTFEYDESGNVSKEIDANNVSISYMYDEYNNQVAKISPELNVDIIIYENVLESIQSSNGTTKWFDYDEFGRVVCEEEEGLDGLNFRKEFTYSNGNISSVRYISNRGMDVTENRFYTNGHLSEVKLNDEKTIYKLIEVNDFGLPTEVHTGNVVRKYEYDEFGNPVRRMAMKGDNVIQDYSYEFDPYRSNLLSRTDNIRQLSEFYDYDDADRLTEYGNETAQYDLSGNITYKSDVGAFGYNNAKKPYAITDVALENNSISTKTQEIKYASFSRPLKITEDNQSAEFSYNGEYDCVKVEEKIFTVRMNINYYSGGCYEYHIGPSTVTERLYLMGDYYDSPVVVINETDDGDRIYQNEICCIVRDYLGSVTNVVFNDRNKSYEYSYDAWGRMRNPQTLEPQSYVPTLYLGRGYCGHVHLSQFNLINMNARLYDPVLGRFLSPDPYVQDSDLAANYNRYSYALNNPFRYKDPNGEFWFGTLFSAVFDLFRNVFTRGTNFSHYSWNRTVNAFKIDLGMFQGNFLQVLNKWTWSLPVSLIGKNMAHVYNISGKIDRVTELDGMLALSGATSVGAMTIGHYSLGPKNYTATWKDHLFVHEYGHYIQTQQWGPLFFPVIALPSLASAAFIDEWSGIDHKNRWFEVNASRLGAKHFDKKYGNGYGEDYFDIKAFSTENVSSQYKNPRTGDNNKSSYHPIKHSDIKHTFWDYIVL